MADSSHSLNNTDAGAILVAWVRTSQDPNKNSDRLSQMFTEEGLSVQIVEIDSTLYDHIGRFDLIMLESFGQVDANTLAAVETIRMGSRAPMVMLMSSYARTETIDALQAGVDAVWALGMPREMLLARCRALLRRWKQA
jgi:DNA-binding response OmpR family regulator